MQQLKAFEFNNQQLTVYGTTDKPLFKAKEVGKILDIKNIHDNMATIPSKYKVIGKTDTLGGMQYMTYITEPALYMLAFKSRQGTEGIICKFIKST